MINIKEYIVEKLIIDKTIQSTNSELEDLLKHFEFDNLYEVDKGRLMKEPYITKEEGEEIKEKLLKFIKDNDCKKENFKYYTIRGKKFKDKKIEKDYKKHNPTIVALNKFKKEHILFNGNYGLKFEANPDEKTIAMAGPLGGIKICSYK